MRKNSILLFHHILCIIFLLSCMFNYGCHRSPVPQEKLHQRAIDKHIQQAPEIDRILKESNALNAKIDMYRQRALEHDQKLNAYRQEIHQRRSDLVSQTGQDRKDVKADIRKLKRFAHLAKKARNAERIWIQIYTEKVKELGADFDALFKETTQ